ncbi:DNA segregation ATPase FtsK/SpoIIIE, S-DNA-T family [Amycolatopsis pretoriensis]|uniref:DNA segregation ATPase FtsK/SpoIIIE, S-DNA-T family n=1 Tax=Amycolatopsis pretoriensis TaxID=218821 RepID=A0A1H5QXU4_9PSEU|nr:zonular occludens toxin domain-containing protein [Amycolatopsis pretoriensis]SEF30158.1 DNA segregation ATPase FtsK/SpoIIIE, S-DNA-T family [Amycolatopsis pretoriensis]
MSTNTNPTASELATVHPLPIRTEQGEAIEGELISEEEYQRLTSQKARAIARYAGYRHDVVVAARTARKVVKHDRTKATFRHCVAYPTAGAKVVVNRWRDTHGANRYERQMRAAEAAGDQEMLRYWQEADVAEKQRRHARTMDWLRAPGQWIKAAVIGSVGVSGFLLVLGIIMAINDGEAGEILTPITGVFDAVAFVLWFLTTYGVFLLVGGTALGVGYLYQQGRTHGNMPTWLAPPVEGDAMDELPDENTILNALKNLNIPGFTRAVKEGWRIKFITPPHVDGKGWRAQVALPPACPVEEIVKRKTTLAHNLVRYPREVWPTEPQPSVLDLWVAKPGALSGPVDPWPLLTDLDTATIDYFTGVPVAVTLKGDVVRGRLFEANYAFGGMMGSGKSTMAINLVLGAMLDPLAEIDVVVMAENTDYNPMRPRLRSLTTGAGDDTVEACLNLLYELYDDLSVRGKALQQHATDRSVTRALAEKDGRLRPRVVVIDECQNLFMGKDGKKAIEVASKLMSTARKYAITLIFLTPEPSKDALPRKITSVASNKACFAIGDQMANDAVLGTGSYKAGISAVGLTPKTDEGPGDVGTCMARGFTAQPGLLRSFYVSPKDAHAVTKRAMALREQTALPAAAPAAPAAPVDHLADIAAVLGTEPRMRTQEVLQGLTEHDRGTYTGWTFGDLQRALPESAKPYKSAGVMQVSAARVRDAIAERDEQDESDGDENEGTD